tara:strand:- start:1515 stop:1886 length:372 start_codon:yes stop_codon:yes gene_type:complete
MPLIHWKQIDGDLSGSRVLTGSLKISGSIDIEALGGVNNFTGSFENSGSFSNTGSFTNQSGSFVINLDPETGNSFSVTAGGEEQISVTPQGVFKLTEKASAPPPVSGGLFYSASDDYFLGFKN